MWLKESGKGGGLYSVVESRRLLLSLVVLARSFGCTTKKPEVEGYRVVNWDAAAGTWVIIRNGTFDGRYLTKRITAVCDFYKLGDNEAVVGPEACDLQVGRMMVPNQFPGEGRRKDFLDIWESSDKLYIAEGDGPDQVHQQFTILKYEVFND